MTTSDPQRCFVYLQLPQSLEVVTCAQFEQRARVRAALLGEPLIRSDFARLADRRWRGRSCETLCSVWRPLLGDDQRRPEDR